jgi:serine protease Do
MRKSIVGLFMLSLLFSGEVVAARDFIPTDNKKWLAVISTKDIDVAIGVARRLGEGAQVVSSRSGYYAVIKGPYAASTVEQVKKIDPNLYAVPTDALLSDGSRYIELVWSAPSSAPTLVDYLPDQPLQLSTGDVTVDIKMEKLNEDFYSTVVSGTEKNGPSFSFTVGKDGEFVTFGSSAAFLKLDASNDVPQLVFTRNAGGAHCCTNTWITLKSNGSAGWTLLDQGKLDGGGYWFEDVDGDGGQELLSVDNSFLYAFDSYAGSFAPLKISKLRFGKVDDVSDEPAMRRRLKQDLAGMEYEAKLDSSLWKSNGFLAGWVAAKMRLGQGEDSWQTVEQNINKLSDFGPQECTTAQSFEDCPIEKLKTIPVLKALASFLKEGGYGPLPEKAEALLR